MFQWIADLVLARRRLVAIALALLFVLCTAGVARLRVDLSFSAFFGRDDPANTAFREFREHWGADDDLILVVVHADGADLLEPDRVRALQAVGRELEALSVVRTVTSIATVPPLIGSEPGQLDLDPIVSSLPEAIGPDWDRWRDRVVEHRLFTPSLVARDGRTAALLVEAKYDTADVNAIRPIVAAIQAVLDATESRSDLRFGMAGIPAVRAAFFSQFLRDQALFVPLGVGFISICLYFVFRRLHGVLVPGLAASLPVAMTFGLMGWSGEPIGLLSQTFTSLLPAIAVADAIHMVSRYHEALRRVGVVVPDRATREAAIREAATQVGFACLLTSVTTAIGFSSLLVADMPVLRSFGLFAAIGVLAAYLGVLFLVPLLLLLNRGGVPTLAETEGTPFEDRALVAVGNLSTRHPWWVLTVTAVVVGLAVFYGARTEVDNHLTRSLQDDHPVTRANLRADEQLGGIIGLEVDLRGEADAFKDPAVVRALLDFERWALQQPAVRQVTSPATWAALLHQATTGAYEAPDSPEAMAQYYLLAEGDPGFVRMVDPDYARARMLITLQDGGGKALIERSDALEAGLRRHLGGIPVTAQLTGTPYVAYRGINGVTHDLRSSLALAFVLISVSFTVLFRSVRFGLISMIPNIIPLVVGYGLLGYMGWLLDPTPAVIFTVALGIAVDDTIHLLMRTREEAEGGLALPDAVREALRHSGRAVVITSVILAFGFGINALSVFKATSVLGWLGATVILAALLCDLFVLPALIVLFGGDRPAKLPPG